jgi:hypothetical protein
MGHNALAIIVAAIVMYLIGFLIYGLAFEQLWMAESGWSEEQVQSGASKMPLGFVIPFLLAIGLSLAIKWRNKPGWLGGAETGFWIGLLFLFAERLYGYVYAPAGGEVMLGIDTLHIFATAVIGGAIIGVWK